MTSPWTISTAAERVELDQAGQAQSTFTVTNNGPVDQRAVLDIAGRPSVIVLSQKLSALIAPPPPPQLRVSITTFEPPESTR